MNNQIEPVKAKQIAVTPQQKVRELLSKQAEQISKALPKFLTPERFIRIALTTINKNPKLLDCTQESLMACIMECAQLGLEPDNVMGRAYLIPFNDKRNNRMVCTLIVGYKGLCDLAYRSGKVKSLMAQIVCEKDKFDFRFGLDHRLDHVPCFEEDRGKVIAVYAYAIMENGVTAFDVMGVDDVERIKGRSKSADNGPWQTDWDEMARKTVLKRLSKYLPLSVEFMDAVAIDNKAEDEDKLKAAKIVLPVRQEVLPAPAESIPMPTKSQESEPRHVERNEGANDLNAQNEDVPEGTPSNTLNLEVMISDAGMKFADFVDVLHGSRMCARNAQSVDDLTEKNVAAFIEDFSDIVDAVRKGQSP